MQGRVVLVTGAARGIGKEVARQLAQDGATVLVSARDAGQARSAANDLGAAGDVRGLGVGLDVADDGSVQAAAAALEADPGRLDVLVNNAAAYVDWSETASGADLSAARQVLEVNLFGAWRLTNALLPLLRQSPHPRIVNSPAAPARTEKCWTATACRCSINTSRSSRVPPSWPTVSTPSRRPTCPRTTR